MHGERENERTPRPPADGNSREHGVSGYTDAPVGGFGEAYEQQAARGRESEPDHAMPADPNDLALSRSLQKALGLAHVDAADLRIDVQAGEVTLYGTVRRPLEKSELEAKARAVPGVRTLRSRLTISRESTRESIP
ncbi:MAG: BON domain-containing protein [Pseudomonadota bacterium]